MFRIFVFEDMKTTARQPAEGCQAHGDGAKDAARYPAQYARRRWEEGWLRPSGRQGLRFGLQRAAPRRRPRVDFQLDVTRGRTADGRRTTPSLS